MSKIVQLLCSCYKPITAGVVEEATFRNFLIGGLLNRGLSEDRAVVYSALLFAFIHGFFLIDKLVVTFAFGLIAGLYYVKERNLPVLIVTHIIVDIITFAMTVYGV
jgi:membrane protease YdiL (CAAX protease family)